MPKYNVDWVKNYFATGTVEIQANSEAEAEEIARNAIGRYEGSVQYDPDGDETTAYKIEEEEKENNG